MQKISLLFPHGTEDSARQLADVTVHDLGLDAISRNITSVVSEQNLIMNTMSKMTADPHVTKYRCDIFSDILNNVRMRTRMMEILQKIDFLREYGSFRRDFEENASAWDLLHRLDEINDYIRYVEAIHECLSDADIHSEGLIGLRDYVDSLYNDKGFDKLKTDICALKATTSSLKSVTLGVNLNERYEANAVGVVSFNSRYFTKSGIIGNFYDHLSSKGGVQQDTDWNGSMRFSQFTAADSKSIMPGLVSSAKFCLQANSNMVTGLSVIPEGDQGSQITSYMDKVADHMISSIVKKTRTVLNQHVGITITDITKLMPQFVYYIRWAEYIESLKMKGFAFCKASVVSDNCRFMKARGIYNLKLASSGIEASAVVDNDLDFDEERSVYILTGANRGGKTTITQAIGLLFILAQGGISVPGKSFEFAPCDGIFTHFPADEDKTMDLGRLGEECKRFRELYLESTPRSLILLNETFSTTSFEEGYYIAQDSVRAILSKGIRTIYNTHMHKLGYDIHELNAGSHFKAASLVMKTDGGRRSFKVQISAPEGRSFADDIARKYGVTYEMLTGNGQ